MNDIRKQYDTSSILHQAVCIKSTGEFKLELQSENAQFGSKSVNIFVLCDLEIWWMTLKNKGHFVYNTLNFVHHFKSISETLNSDKNRRFVVLRDLGIWRMTLKNNRAHLLYYVKLCASFHSHQWIHTEVAVRKHFIRVKTVDCFWSHVTLKLYCWPWKTIGHLFYAASSFVHHFITINELKLELQSGTPQFWTKSMFLSRVTFKFDRWHWKTIWHIFYATSSFAHNFIALGEFKLLQSGNAQFGSKLTNFLALWPWNLTVDLEKQ